MSSRCAPTAYAISRGTGYSVNDYTKSGDPTCYWWLRSPGWDAESTAVVNLDGSLGYRWTDDLMTGVRPAIVISLE